MRENFLVRLFAGACGLPSPALCLWYFASALDKLGRIVYTISDPGYLAVQRSPGGRRARRHSLFKPVCVAPMRNLPLVSMCISAGCGKRGKCPRVIGRRHDTIQHKGRLRHMPTPRLIPRLKEALCRAFCFRAKRWRGKKTTETALPGGAAPVASSCLNFAREYKRPHVPRRP